MKIFNNKERELDNILENCLEKLLGGQMTIDECLEDNPEYASELEPLLKTAITTHQAVRIEPRPEFKIKASYQFREALHEAATKKQRYSLAFTRFIPHWAVALAIMLVVVMAGSGTVVAANDDMPDSVLYPVKLAGENMRLVFSFNQSDKIGIMAELADNRVNEIVYMANHGDEKQLEVLTSRLDMRLDRMAAMMPNVYSDGGGILFAPASAPVPRMTEPQGALSVPDYSSEAPNDSNELYGVTSSAGKSEESLVTGDAPSYYYADEDDILRQTIMNYAMSHPEKLRDALKNAPPPLHPVMERAIEIAEQRYQMAIIILQQNEANTSP